MKRIILSLLVCSVSLTVSKANLGTASSDLDQFVEKWLTDNKVSGVSVGMLKDGRLAFAKGYGLANRESKLVPTTDTVWLMASCSKPVVGIAALKLMDQGKLNLDKDVSEYLGFTLRNPNFLDEKITMRHLLAHVSSLKDAGQSADISNYPRPDPPQQLEKDICSRRFPSCLHHLLLPR
ncbi:MAG: beta-lactamase family protein [Verrucomicrobia bacterium]|nr:beta-lactamase family protein [Verrucomicrobiota bacterium]